MASRATLRTLLRTFLGAESDDPAFTDTILDELLQQAYYGLIGEVNQAKSDYTAIDGALTAESATSRTYRLGAQHPTFARWLEVRFTDSEGLRLSEARSEELLDAGGDSFAITGADASATLVTSPGTEAGKALWIKFAQWPAVWTTDSDTPALMPLAFHDLVALEATFAFGLGGEQRVPPEISERHFNRRAQFFAHIGRRGVAPSRTRLDQGEE